MREYSEYLGILRGLIEEADEGARSVELWARISAALDGEPSAELRRLIPLGRRREAGAFFTGSVLATRTLASFARTFKRDSTVLDPACGAGDLLLACLDGLAKVKFLDPASDDWQHQIAGRDLHTEFAEATRLRLHLKTLTIFPEMPLLRSGKALGFPAITAGNGLKDPTTVQGATHIVLNPPFGRVQVNDDCAWANGKASEAAVFLEAICQQAGPGTRVVAILPDSLRSGSRYEKWRRTILRLGKPEGLQLFGQFDRSADVDVFALQLRITTQSKQIDEFNWTQVPDDSSHAKVRDLFVVSVGPVVDFRDPRDGELYPFITGRGLPAWETIQDVPGERRFSGRLTTPPFVAVRRTSRLGDAYRAVATVIDYDGPVAVENHVIVLSPRDGSLETCRKLMESLKLEETTDWLNRRIRCRHLTVKALAELPLWNEAK